MRIAATRLAAPLGLLRVPRTLRRSYGHALGSRARLRLAHHPRDPSTILRRPYARPLPGLAAVELPVGWIEWTLGWGLWARVAVFALAAGVMWLSWANLRDLPGRGRAGVLLCLRGLLLAALLLVFLQPTWVRERVRRGGRVVAVVLDASSSMGLGGGGESRWDRALRVARALSSRGEVRLYTGGSALRPRTPGQLEHARPEGRRTDLLGALQELGDLKRPGGLGAVVLISDGLDNDRLQARLGRLPAGRAVDGETSAALARLGVPVHAVFIDDPTPPRDLVVTAIRSSPYGFVRNILPVTVLVELHGYDRGGGVEVVLRDNGRPVASTRLPLAGPARRSLSMEVQPQSTGPHVLSASIASLPDEATTVNNEAHVLLQVIRDRTRVMHLAGHPSWDTRFLRTHLRGDGGVELVSFYVMVGQGARLYVQTQDTTLIPFPTRELFEEALDDFDLVIFHDFRFGTFDIERHLPRLEAYVRRGGALLVIGGRQALAAGGYGQTALAPWLPLRVGVPIGADTGHVEGPFVPLLTSAGRTHPLTRLLPSARDTAALWATAALSGHNTALSPREGAPTLLESREGLPLLAAGDHGLGRVAVLATDSMWRWAFPPSSVRDRAALRSAYHRFFDRMVGWLTHAPAWEALRLTGPSSALDRGEQATLVARLTQPDGRPAAGVALRWRARPLPVGRGDAGGGTAGDGGGGWAPVPGRTDAQGRLAWRWSSRHPGPCRVEVTATLSGQRHLAATALAVRRTDREGRRIRPDDRALRALTAASGGRMYRGPPDGPVPMVSSRAQPELTEKVRVELWSGPWVLLLLVSLLTVEWLLRRRWGLA